MQCVYLNSHCSAFAPEHSGVPQHSVLGPLLVIIYIKPLSAIIDSQFTMHHTFSNDLQLQMSAPSDKISELLYSMQATANMIKFSDNKTELMLVTSK